MINLLKVDLKRIVKDKLFFVTCIIGLVFSIITPLLYKILFSGFIGDGGDDIFSMFFSFEAMFFGSFSLTNDFGLIVPILLLIIIAKDFSFGTIRNKIISGHSRSKIFLSMFFSTAITIVGVMLVHSLLSGALTLLLFPNFITDFTSEMLKYFILSICFEILVLIFIAALLSFLVVFMKNVGLAIITYVAIILLSTAFVGVMQIAIELLSLEPESYKTTVDILTELLRINVFYNNSTVIGLKQEYIDNDILYIILSTVSGIGVFSGFGLLVFNKKDIK